MKKAVTFLLLGLIATPLVAQNGAQPAMSEVFMKQFDTNKDGKVSKAEFLKPSEAQFNHIDKNGDGSIDAAEIEAFSKEVQKRMQESRAQGGGQPQHPSK